MGRLSGKPVTPLNLKSSMAYLKFPKINNTDCVQSYLTAWSINHNNKNNIRFFMKPLQWERNCSFSTLLTIPCCCCLPSRQLQQLNFDVMFVKNSLISHWGHCLLFLLRFTRLSLATNRLELCQIWLKQKNSRLLYNEKDHCTAVLIACIILLCLCWIKNRFTYLVESKPVKQEVSHTVILSLTNKLSYSLLQRLKTPFWLIRMCWHHNLLLPPSSFTFRSWC